MDIRRRCRLDQPDGKQPAQHPHRLCHDATSTGQARTDAQQIVHNCSRPILRRVPTRRIRLSLHHRLDLRLDRLVRRSIRQGHMSPLRIIPELRPHVACDERYDLHQSSVHPGTRTVPHIRTLTSKGATSFLNTSLKSITAALLAEYTPIYG